MVLLTRFSGKKEREWYAAQAIGQGWSGNVPGMQIETRAYQRSGQAVTNFAARLPAVQSDFNQQALKDPYLFNLLGLSNEANERDTEQGLTRHITRFLLEMGAGFAFIGRQVLIEVVEDDSFIDLLFYHFKLRCSLVIELKVTDFRPEHAGQLSFYLTAVDRQNQSCSHFRAIRNPESTEPVRMSENTLVPVGEFCCIRPRTVRAVSFSR